MKYLVLLTLVGILLVSLFDVFEADITNNTVAIALMLLLLALFSDLKEFNFWGLSGKKKEEELRKLVGSPIISDELDEKPSAYKLKKAFKDDEVDQMGNLKDNFLAVSYDIERMLRIIVRATTRSTEETAVLTPESVLNYLEDEEFLTPEACDAIEKLREVRKTITESGSKVPTETLEASLKLSLPIHQTLKEWLDESSKR